ncbi:MAG: SigB/SigF/SigG family RNA polymerase sigma factor [Desertimonas sp.]
MVEADDAPDRALFETLVRTRDRRLRNRLVERHMGLAIHVARRFARRGPSDEELRQVAFLALVKAVDRFDPGRGVAFSTFAGRTVEGEIKRYFRDQTWAVRVPRSSKELHLGIRRAADELVQQLGRAPTVGELAERIGVSTDEVIEGVAAGLAYTAASLDAPVPADHRATGHEVAVTDAAIDQVGEVDAVRRLIARLPRRDQEVVRLRFYERLSQAQIADRVGVSQMHVSRLLRRSLEQMRRAADPR